MDNTVSTRTWTDTSNLDSLLKRVNWDVRATPQGRIPLELRSTAVEIVNGQLRNKATVHGDIHLRNILVRDREPFLIDFANSGPGHPCFDLVRFESAMLFQTLRPTQDESALVEFCLELFRGASETSLQSKFPILYSSVTNRIAANAVGTARTECLKLLATYGGGIVDYYSMKLVVACQSLCMPQFQTSVVRAAITAISTLIEDKL